jgi:hypothetical protein
MKKLIMIAVFAFVVSAGAVFAQGFEKNKKLTQEEVPAAVLQSFQKEYANLQDKGNWTLYFRETQQGGRSVFKPEHYVFSGKNNGGKISISYAPDGTLENTKGISKESSGSK